MTRLYFGCAFALALAACSNHPVETDPTATAGDDVVLVDDGTPVDPAGADAASQASVSPTDAATYLAMAAAADKWEVEASRVLLKKTERADVRAFAQMMVDQHSATTEKLKSVAASAKAVFPVPALAVDQQGMLSEIRTAPVQEVDATYLRHQKRDRPPLSGPH